jgi:hypothetical protein
MWTEFSLRSKVPILLFPMSSTILNDPLEEIDDPTPVPEVLWMFSRRKGNEKLTFTLQDNPHFYHEFPLKDSVSEFDSWKDGRGFHRDPLTEIGPGLEQTGTIYIIPDKPCRLFLDVPEPRVFGNLWCPQKKVILKGECISFTCFPCTPTRNYLRYSGLFGFRRQYSSQNRPEDTGLLVPTVFHGCIPLTIIRATIFSCR